MSESEREALHLCEEGLQQMWKGEIDSAIELYDRAAVLATGDETREMITIRKAEALIAADRDGAEISALPAIVMRRRSSRHVYIASAVLMRRLCERDDRRKAIFYGEIARTTAAEAADPLTRGSILNALGVTLVADSQFKSAIEVFDEGITALGTLPAGEQVHSLRAALLANLGGAKVLRGDHAEGVFILETVLHDLRDAYDRAEALLDLCFGYMEMQQTDIAEQYGRRALQLAAIPRQVRNGNHLLGEICLRTERYDEADGFFDVVAGFYPDFRNVKQLLVAVDLCAVVNWKA
jgi:tetratricopeptide (TPR) repeat protein